MRIPAHTTALGKTMLSDLDEFQFQLLFPGESIEAFTPYTLTDKSSLYEQLQKIKRQGFAYDLQESVIGFCCAAAPVRDVSGHLIAAVSCSMPSHVWEDKKERAVEEITKLARRLTLIHE